MAYRAIVDFKDLRDGHEYKTGDTYPHTGKVDAERVKQLAAPTQQRGPLIEEAPEPVAAPASRGRKKKED